MKKILITLICLTFTTATLAEYYFEIEWSDICPSKYENIDTTKYYFNQEKKYWAKRKIAFENKIQTCKNLSKEDKNACYEQLKIIENNKTRNHQQEKQLNTLKSILINQML